VRNAGKKQRRQKISKSGKPKAKLLTGARDYGSASEVWGAAYLLWLGETQPKFKHSPATSILWAIRSKTTNHKNLVKTSDRWLAGSVGIRDHVEKFALA
jgi:hypothetical protein